MRKRFDENLTLILNICHTETHWLKRANMLVQTTKSVKERYGIFKILQRSLRTCFSSIYRSYIPPILMRLFFSQKAVFIHIGKFNYQIKCCAKRPRLPHPGDCLSEPRLWFLSGNWRIFSFR